MADPRFFQTAGPLTLGEAARLASAELDAATDPERQMNDVAPLDAAGANDVSFFDNARYLDSFQSSKAGACVVAPKHVDRAPKGMALLITPNPYRGYAMVARAFYPPPARTEGRHPSAIVDTTAQIGQGCEIGPGAVIGAKVKIDQDCVVGPNAVIGDSVEIGAETEIGANAVLTHCLIGARCHIHAGVCIGNRGFGFAMDAQGILDVPQLGRVIVEDDVEVGANTAIDRGAGPDTVIGAGSKIDNLVQIGHNVRLGRQCVLVAQSGIAGSATLEDHVAVAAQAGVAGHLNVGKGARVAAKSGAMRDVPPGQAVGGTPAMPLRDYFRLCTIWQRQLNARGKRDE
jgi:UDP-3-O-[3-hydroxymyristoyl] glucosamine N-acyltransferase